MDQKTDKFFDYLYKFVTHVKLRNLMNFHLKFQGRKSWVNHRSYAERGLIYFPNPKYVDYYKGGIEIPLNSTGKIPKN